MLPGLSGVNRVLLGFTWFYLVLPSFTVFYWLLLGLTWCSQLQPVVLGFYLVFMGIYLGFIDLDDVACAA